MSTNAADTAPGVRIITLGCRLNSYESEVMRRHAAEAGLSEAVIVNTCAVTGEAERQARQAIRKARRDHPLARIIVTGCAAQIDPARFAAMPEVDQVLGNAEKLAAASFRPEPPEALARVQVADIQTPSPLTGPPIAGFEGRSRAFVQVQQGCDHRCTFCIIPFGRGRSRSVPVATVVTQVRTLVEAGYRELVLSGVDIASWGGDLPERPTLGALVAAVLAEVPELPRLRLSSLDPAALDDRLWRLIAEAPRLMPQLHLSVQAGDDLILKRMRRRHDRKGVLDLVARARALRPDMVFGADLIAGFPTETEAMAEQSLRLVAEAGLTWLHVFPYSPRPGTPAARMPQVAPAQRTERAARLRAAGAEAAATLLASLVGQEASVLVEDHNRGHTEQFAPIQLDRPVPPGALVPVTVTASNGQQLAGTVLDPSNH